VESTSDSGVKGNADSENPAMPADGSKVAFRSLATNLTTGDTDTNFDEYVKDLATGHVSLISTSDSGVKGNGDNANPVFSADGTKVAFRSSSTNLDPADTDTTFDIYVKTLATGDITLASTSSSGVKGNKGSYNPFLSADGKIVAFRSYSTNLDPGDTDKILDVYVKNLVTGHLTLASTSSAGVKGNGASGNPALSADGTKVAFYSSATNLVPGDMDSIPDVYVKDLVTGQLTLASTSDTGVKGNGQSILPYLSPDGTQVVFSSEANNLDPADRNRIMDVYSKNLVTGNITLVSTSSTGVNGNGPSVNPYLSADGTKVAFTSRSTNLDPMDKDALEDIYMKNLTTGTLTLLSTSSAGVKGNADSLNPAMSGDGSLVAFYSGATNLDPADTDPILDIYVKAI